MRPLGALQWHCTPGTNRPTRPRSPENNRRRVTSPRNAPTFADARWASDILFRIAVSPSRCARFHAQPMKHQEAARGNVRVEQIGATPAPWSLCHPPRNQLFGLRLGRRRRYG
jgi:hypothetical protein